MAKKAREAKEAQVNEKKDSFLRDNYVVINDFRDEDGTGVVTSVMHIRGIGTQVREEAYQGGKLVGVSSNFIHGVKVKTKKDWKFLILDKGPKSRKTEAEEDSEDEIDD